VELVTIGQFSKVCWLSIKALRLYDELGLLEPAFIDPRTGYRYYEPAQASRARAIALLRSLDMPLLDIKDLLAESDPDKLRSKLEAHHADLESRLRDHQYMLRRVEQLMKRGELVSYEITVKEIEPTRVVGAIVDTTPESISSDAPAVYHQLYDSLTRRSIAPAGPPRLIYLEMEDDAWRIEPCVPVAEDINGEDELQVHEMRGGRVATALHVGPYDELGIAWDEVSKWVTARGHKTGAQPYDVYLNDPSEVDDPSQLRTELVWPIR
jgi:effector-binding domain-containing protein